MKISSVVVLLLPVFFNSWPAFAENAAHGSFRNTLQDSHKVKEVSVVFLVTLGGTIYGVDVKRGTLLWSHNENSVIRSYMPQSPFIDLRPLFIPDPTDGSLHDLSIDGNGYTPPRKLPVTIQELVRNSPHYGPGEVVQLGNKKDVWFELDANTGDELYRIEANNFNQTCPETNTLHGCNRNRIARFFKSEYTLTLVNRTDLCSLINITYSHYHRESERNHNDKLLDRHFLTSIDGHVVSVDKNSMKVLWSTKLNSPAIHLFKDSGHSMVESPLTYVSSWLLQSLKTDGDASSIFQRLSDKTVSVISKHMDTYYAVQSHDGANRLIMTHPVDGLHIPHNEAEHVVLIRSLIKSHSDGSDDVAKEAVTDVVRYINELASSKPGDNFSDFAIETFSSKVVKNNVKQDSFFTINRIVVVVVIASFVPILLYNGGRARSAVLHVLASLDGKSKCEDNAAGKICFDPGSVLGRGCGGTSVFTGTFEGRPVAVKRILSDHAQFVSQEVEVLRDSIHHSNVVRYFCMEARGGFTYIALELCGYNLNEFVTNPNVNKHGLGDVNLLHQSLLGLEYLHSMRIVHRDVKPHNILISVPDHLGIVRAVISDFGLCKKLPPGRSSFSTVSSVFVGTQGWIAPEVFDKSKRITSSCDIFSLGCVAHFVLSKGSHPFGDELGRQSNINEQKSDLSKIPSSKYCYEIKHMVSSMISFQPDRRPTASNLTRHVFFWSPEDRCHFVQAISNYGEKLASNHPFIKKIEMNSIDVVRGSWVFHLPVQLQEDMLQHRDYSCASVRDLLRAIRNKFNHFKGSPDHIKALFQFDPDNVVGYFSDLFPKLLLHLYLAVKDYRREKPHLFTRYYLPNSQERH